MLKAIRDNFKKLTARKTESLVPRITERSTISDIEKIYPNTARFFEERYGLKLSANQMRTPLSRFVDQLSIPAQIIYMEIQLFHQSAQVKEIDAPSAKLWMDENKDLIVLDVRENWERTHGTLPNAIALTEDVLETDFQKWSRNHPVLVYCHFGIRSGDAAIFLMNEGFKDVRVLRGGIDAWSQQVDSTVPRYEQAWC